MSSPFSELCAAARLANGEEHLDRLNQVKEVIKTGYQSIHYRLKQINTTLEKLENRPEETENAVTNEKILADVKNVQACLKTTEDFNNLQKKYDLLKAESDKALRHLYKEYKGLKSRGIRPKNVFATPRNNLSLTLSANYYDGLCKMMNEVNDETDINVKKAKEDAERKDKEEREEFFAMFPNKSEEWKERMWRTHKRLVASASKTPPQKKRKVADISPDTDSEEEY